MSHEQYKIEKLEKNEIKDLFKSGFSLFFRVPIASFFLAVVVAISLFSSHFFIDTGLMYLFPLILLPIISHHICQSNDNSSPVWQFDKRYFKFIPFQYIIFIVLVTVFVGFMHGLESFFNPNETEEESSKQSAEWMAVVAYILLMICFPALLGYVFGRCNFNSILTMYCANKWQLMNLDLKEDFKALVAFHELVGVGYNKNHLLIFAISFGYFFVVLLLSLLLIGNSILLFAFVSFSICLLHNFFYVVVKHICKDGGINDKVKEKSFQYAEGM